MCHRFALNRIQPSPSCMNLLLPFSLDENGIHLHTRYLKSGNTDRKQRKRASFLPRQRNGTKLGATFFFLYLFSFLFSLSFFPPSLPFLEYRKRRMLLPRRFETVFFHIDLYPLRLYRLGWYGPFSVIFLVLQWWVDGRLDAVPLQSCWGLLSHVVLFCWSHQCWVFFPQMRWTSVRRQ